MGMLLFKLFYDAFFVIVTLSCPIFNPREIFFTHSLSCRPSDFFRPLLIDSRKWKHLLLLSNTNYWQINLFYWANDMKPIESVLLSEWHETDRNISHILTLNRNQYILHKEWSIEIWIETLFECHYRCTIPTKHSSKCSLKLNELMQCKHFIKIKTIVLLTGFGWNVLYCHESNVISAF